MIKRNCPLCGMNSFSPLEIDEPDDKVGHNVLCNHCGLIYHNPVMDYDEMISYYNSSFSGEYHESEEMQRELAENHLAYIQTACGLTDIAPVLEIGCAYGDLLKILKENSVDASGIEPSSALSETGRKTRNVSIKTGHYEAKETQPKHYGMIILLHVLEHFSDPLSVLRKIHSELKDQGLLYIEVPTIAASQLATVFKTIHPTVFVKETLETMLIMQGFRIKASKQKGSNLSVIACKTEPASIKYPDAEKITQQAKKYIQERSRVLTNIRETMESIKNLPEIAIYGAGHNTLDLNEIYPLKDLNIERVYDADPAKQNNRLLDYEIRPPAELHNFNGSCVIISTYAYQEEICRQLSYLEERGVKLIRLYEK